MKQEIYRRGHWRIRSEEKNIHRRRGLLPEPARGAWFFLIRFDASGGQRGVSGFSARCRTTSKDRTITRVRRAESAPNRRLENAEWRSSDPRKKVHANPFRSSLGSSKERYLRFLAALLRFDFFVVFFGFSVAASSRRFFAAQPGLLTWRPRAIPNPSAGTVSVMVEPAAM